MLKNAHDLKQKKVGLTRDNFTFSSKLIVGTFLQLKEPYNNLVNNLNSNNAQQLINYDASLSALMDDSVDDKIKKELKFDILSEEEIIAKISELNPSFKRRTSAFSSMNSNANSSLNSGNSETRIKKSLHDDDHALESGSNGHAKTNGDVHKYKLKKEPITDQSFHENDTEQEQASRSKQAQLEIAHKIMQEEHERQLKLQFQAHANMLSLQMNSGAINNSQQQHIKNNQKQLQIMQQQNIRMQQHQEKQQLQQKVKFELIEAKRKEKYLQRERKTREKWYLNV